MNTTNILPKEYGQALNAVSGVTNMFSSGPQAVVNQASQAANTLPVANMKKLNQQFSNMKNYKNPVDALKNANSLIPTATNVNAVLNSGLANAIPLPGGIPTAALSSGLGNAMGQLSGSKTAIPELDAMSKLSGPNAAMGQLQSLPGVGNVMGPNGKNAVMGQLQSLPGVGNAMNPTNLNPEELKKMLTEFVEEQTAAVKREIAKNPIGKMLLGSKERVLLKVDKDGAQDRLCTFFYKRLQTVLQTSQIIDNNLDIIYGFGVNQIYEANDEDFRQYSCKRLYDIIDEKTRSLFKELIGKVKKIDPEIDFKQEVIYPSRPRAHRSLPYKLKVLGGYSPGMIFDLFIV